MKSSKCILCLFFLTIFLLCLSQAAKDNCPVVKGIWGCAYMAKCFGDSMCSNGHKCCPHPCGSQCVKIVHCDPVECELKCEFGMDQDSHGCDVCKCRTTKKCAATDIMCLLKPLKPQ